MLEFIVLGHIPGTDTYLPFAIILPVAVVLYFLAAFYLRYFFEPREPIYQQNKDLPPIELVPKLEIIGRQAVRFGHKVLVLPVDTLVRRLSHHGQQSQ